jgi:hypothetical protein
LSPRADHLRSCLQLISQIEGTGRKAEMGARTRNLLAQYARSVPGALVDAWNSGQEVELKRVRTAVQAELELIGAEDERSRKREADRASRTLTEEQLMWGGATPQVVVLKAG